MGHKLEHATAGECPHLGLAQPGAGQIRLPVEQLEVGTLVAELLVLELAPAGNEFLGDLVRLDLELTPQVLGFRLEIAELQIEAVLTVQGRLEILVKLGDLIKPLPRRRRLAHGRFELRFLCLVELFAAPGPSFCF